MNKMTKHHIRMGDMVKVITGTNKGVIGKINSITSKNSTVTIDTITPRIKYVKNKQSGETQKLELSIPINISNVMLWDKTINKSSKTGTKIVNDQKVRYFKKSNNIVVLEK
jgi:large subunit ribosomal protein L24